MAFHGRPDDVHGGGARPGGQATDIHLDHAGGLRPQRFDPRDALGHDRVLLQDRPGDLRTLSEGAHEALISLGQTELCLLVRDTLDVHRRPGEEDGILSVR